MKTTIKILVLIIFLLTFLGRGFSQPVQQVWINHYPNGSPSGMVLDQNGNVFITGEVLSSSQSNNYITIKYNSSGVQQWSAIYNGPGNEIDLSYGIALDFSKNVYVTGGSELTTLGTFEYATIKYDSSGNQQWIKRYGAPNHIGSFAYAIAIDKQGYIYVTGSSNRGDSYGRGDYCTIKYNFSGDTIWTRRYTGVGNYMFGSSLDIARSITIDDSDYVYITGQSGIPNSPYFNDIITIKYKQNGDSVWARRFSTLGDDIGYKILTDHYGNVYVTGESNDGNSGQDYIAIKYNPAGVQQWVQRYDGGALSTDVATSEVLDKNGNIYITGYSTYNLSSNYDYATIKYLSSGSQQWITRYNGTGNGTDHAYDIAVDDSCNSYVTGGSLNSNNQYEFITIKYNTSGNQQWLISHLAGSGGWGHNIAVDSLRNVFVTGVDTFGITTIKYSQPTSVNKISNKIPVNYKLYQNYPNPFNPSTNIEFDIVKTSNVEIMIYDVLGRLISVLVNEQLSAGKYKKVFEANNISSGTYFYLMRVNGEILDSKIMSLIR